MLRNILFYKFVNLADPDMTMLWQRELCTRLNITGRIIVSPQGINGTLAGDIEDLRRYKRAMNASGVFRGIHYKWSDISESAYPRLSVKSRKELVAFEADDEIKIDDETGIIGGGVHLRPEELHTFLNENPDAVFFDGRNLYESNVGNFKDAVVPQVNTSREFVKEIEKEKYHELKSKPVVTYCTGGIRCEILSVLMKNRGFENVYQLSGGIVTYGKDFPKSDLWQGSCYVFDGRILDQFSDEYDVIGKCKGCAETTENYSHCADQTCGAQILVCDNCAEQGRVFACDRCSSPAHAPA